MAAADAITVRCCPRCKTVKSLAAFSILKSGRPNGYCKACRREQAMEWARENRERRRAYNVNYRRTNAQRLRRYDRIRTKDPVRRAAGRPAIERWHRNNPDRVRAAMRRHDAKRKGARKLERILNRETVYARSRRWVLLNPELVRSYYRNYRVAHPEKVREADRNNKARRRGAAQKHTASDIAALFVRQQGLCAYCRAGLVRSGPGRFHVDHDVPLVRGGSNGPENLALACPSCNLRKHTMTGAEFRAVLAKQTAA
ncbi:MAG: HNH endonuclease [Steroidobacteraceae bacterium]